MEKILLLNLPVFSARKQSNETLALTYNPPLGLIYIASMLELNGYDSIVLDLCRTNANIYHVLEVISEEKPVVVGISTYTENIDIAINYSKIIKSKYPNIKIVFGGPHSSLQPEYGTKSKYVDFVIIKEGEATFLELVEAIVSDQKHIKYEDIPGIIYKKDKEVIKNKLRKTIADLDLLPIAKREFLDIDSYGQMINIVTSRGCPGNCIYCAATALSGAKYRVRDIGNTLLEIILMIDSFEDDDKVYYFIDDTFTGITSRVTEFIKLKKKYNLKFKWRCESRVDVMTAPLIQEMAANECKGIVYGIESGCQEILDTIRKNINLKQAEQVINYSCDTGMYVCTNFMLGHYCDTKETMGMTLNFIKKLYERNKMDAMITYNTPFPGTWQYTHKDKLGINIILKDYSEFTVLTPSIETANFTAQDQVDIYMKASQYILTNDFGIDT